MKRQGYTKTRIVIDGIERTGYEFEVAGERYVVFRARPRMTGLKWFVCHVSGWLPMGRAKRDTRDGAVRALRAWLAHRTAEDVIAQIMDHVLLAATRSTPTYAKIHAA